MHQRSSEFNSLVRKFFFDFPVKMVTIFMIKSEPKKEYTMYIFTRYVLRYFSVDIEAWIHEG